MNKTNSKFKQISIEDIDYPLPVLKDSYRVRTRAIATWLNDWIENDLKNNKISVGDLLPSKMELAYLIGCSVGTIQVALRFLEDKNRVQSIQRIGTFICDSNSVKFRKLTTKRETAIEKIKSYIQKNDLPVGHVFPPIRNVAKIVGYSYNTALSALEYLCDNNIMERNINKISGRITWKVKSKDFEVNIAEQITLTEKIYNELKEYIQNNFNVGDRLPAHEQLAKLFNTSSASIFAARKTLIKEGILLAKRGDYGTYILRKPNEMPNEKLESSIFASAKETSLYFYEKAQNMLKKEIAENYPIGTKLPSVNEFSEKFEISPNAVRRGLQKLGKEGYVVFVKGRYGGSFVIDTPQIQEQGFKWLSVNPSYVKTLN